MTGRTLLGLAVPALGLAALVAGPADAQTRLTLAGGVLVPFGDLEDTTDPSVRVGIRAEYQPVNALGEAEVLSFHLYVAYADLSLKPEIEEGISAGDGETDPYLVEAGAALRVYSKVAPFFATAGAGYVRHRPAGGERRLDGLDVHGGLGFLVPLGLFLVEPEATLHEVLQDGGDFQFLSANLGIALPF